ncbi:hypothetical protein HHE03_04960 [Helicobacter heilmannii]|nr:hypothetical protein HHE03_04960 [Helicobacter heilmannii]
MVCITATMLTKCLWELEADQPIIRKIHPHNPAHSLVLATRKL